MRHDEKNIHEKHVTWQEVREEKRDIMQAYLG
jgi:hypothetical protein